MSESQTTSGPEVKRVTVSEQRKELKRRIFKDQMKAMKIKNGACKK